MPGWTDDDDQRPDPLSDRHEAFPEASAPLPTGPPLPDSAWAPSARTAQVGGPPAGPFTAHRPPAPATAAGYAPTRRRRWLRTVVVVWLCFAVFGHHDKDSGDSEAGGGQGGVWGIDAPDPPADGHDPTVLLPAASAVGTVPAGVIRFRVEVASTDDTVTVSQSSRQGDATTGAPGSWSGDVDAEAGYQARLAPTGRQSTKGPVGPKVSAIVTATAADPSSTVQCRVYADGGLVLMSTGPGAVTCRVPAVTDTAG